MKSPSCEPSPSLIGVSRESGYFRRLPTLQRLPQPHARPAAFGRLATLTESIFLVFQVLKERVVEFTLPNIETIDNVQFVLNATMLEGDARTTHHERGKQ